MPKHSEQRRLPYSQDQLYALVGDIERYPEFLPWCVGARIRSRGEGEAVADLVIGFKIYRERFTSKVTFTPPGEIHATYSDGPFKYLENNWRFEPLPDGGCLVDFYVDFEFKSKILERLIDALFGEAVRRMVGAFEARARKLYGPAPAAVPVAGFTGRPLPGR